MRRLTYLDFPGIHLTLSPPYDSYPMRNFLFITLIALGFLLPDILHAQRRQDTIDIVYLKSGKSFQGRILPHENANKIRLSTANQGTLVIDVTAVDSIGQQEWRPVHVPVDSAIAVFRPRKVTLRVEAGLERHLFWDSPFYIGRYKNGFSLNAGIGLNITRRFIAGLELGYQQYGALSMIPVAADLRVRCMNRRLSPVIALTLGHLFMIQPNGTTSPPGDKRGSTTSTPQLGMSYCLSRRMAVHVCLGLHFQEWFWKTRALPLSRFPNLRTETVFAVLRGGISF